MIRFQKISKLTLACYLFALGLIGFVFTAQLLELNIFSSKVRIGILISAAIIGVFGSIYSLSEQLMTYLKKR